MKRTIASLMFAAVTCTSVTAWGQTNLYLVRVGNTDSLNTSQVLSNPNDPQSPLVANPNNAFWIGHIPTAIAYGKGNLFVAGIQNGTALPLDGDDADGDTNVTETTPFTCAVVRVGSVLTNRTFTRMPASRAFVPNSRGYIGGDYSDKITGGQVAFSFDSGGTGAANAVSVFGNVDGAGTPTAFNQIGSGTPYRGAVGVSFDFGPTGNGFASIGNRPAIAYMLFGDAGPFGFDSGNLTATFAAPVYGPLSLFNPSNGDSAGNTLHRDVDCDPNNGNFATAGNVGVRVGTRNPDGSVTVKPYSPILPDGAFNGGGGAAWQHVNILHGLSGGDAIVMNRRPDGNPQNITDCIKMYNFSDGTARAYALLNAAGAPIVYGTTANDVTQSSGGLYDFGWEQSTNTLVILDGLNRKYYIFSTEQPAPCCVGTTCFIMNPSNCTAAHVGGVVTGAAGSVCGPTTCIPATACCFPNGTCQVLDAAACGTAGGTTNAATACTPNPCPQPSTGRCCVGARCTIVAQAECVNGGGAAGTSFTAAATDCNATNVFNTPCCFADYNKAGGVSVQDIFDFLTDWFNNNPNANVQGNGAAPSVQDIFDFLTAWFGGGC